MPRPDTPGSRNGPGWLLLVLMPLFLGFQVLLVWGCSGPGLSAGLYPYSVRGEGAKAVARLRGEAAHPRISRAREAKNLLARTLVDHVYAFRLADSLVPFTRDGGPRDALLLDLAVLVGEPVKSLDAETEARILSRVKAELTVLVRPSGDLGILARSLEGWDAPDRRAGDLHAVAVGDGPGRAAARLYIIAQGVRALGGYLMAHGVVPPLATRTVPSRPVWSVAHHYPFPCAPVLSRWGKLGAPPSRAWEARSGCGSLCPGGDCWRPLGLVVAADGSAPPPDLLVLAWVVRDLERRIAAAVTDAATDDQPAYRLVPGLLEAAAAALERPLPVTESPLENLALALPGARPPAGRWVLTAEGGGWRLGLRPEVRIGTDEVRWPATSPPADAVGSASDADLPVLLMRSVRAVEPAAPEAARSRVVTAYLVPDAKAERLTVLFAAARSAGFKRVELAGRAVGGGWAVVAAVDLAAPLVVPELVLVAAGVVERAADGAVLHGVERPIRLRGERTGGVTLRFDPVVPVGLVLDTLEELAAGPGVVAVATAGPDAIVDAREVAELERVKVSATYDPKRAAVAHDALDGTLRGCHASGLGRGTARVRIIVSAAGEVLSIKVLSSSWVGDHGAALRRCWASAARRMVLPRPSSDGMVVVDHELKL